MSRVTPLANLTYRNMCILPDVRFHDLRHSHHSRALALGERPATIGRLLAHAKVGNTVRYAHLARHAYKAAWPPGLAHIGAHVIAEGAETE